MKLLKSPKKKQNKIRWRCKKNTLPYFFTLFLKNRRDIMNELGEIERKVLGALLKMSDETLTTKRVTLDTLAKEINYKTSGGAITYALRLLEKNNYIIKLPEKRIKILV